MQLGFVSAILPDLSLEEVFKTARAIGFDCVEVMCWPVGKSDRRYAGVTHLDVDALDDQAVRSIQGLCAQHGVTISGLGYYPNPLAPEPQERDRVVNHLRKVMHGAARLGLAVVNTFIGRDPHKTVDANWPGFLETWRPIVGLAEQLKLRIGIENCPMLFGDDEWPGGKNLAIAPAIWRRMFQDIPSTHFGLNYDPSHLIWQFIDPVKPIQEFAGRLVHVHAKDARRDWDKLDAHGILNPACHTPKLPGMGDVPWGKFIGALADAGYQGPVCVEVEDRAFEKTFDDRIRSLTISHAFLRQFVR